MASNSDDKGYLWHQYEKAKDLQNAVGSIIIWCCELTLLLRLFRFSCGRDAWCNEWIIRNIYCSRCMHICICILLLYMLLFFVFFCLIGLWKIRIADKTVVEQRWRQRNLQKRVINNVSVLSQNGRLVSNSGVWQRAELWAKQQNHSLVHKQRSIIIIKYIVVNYSSVFCPLSVSPPLFSLHHILSRHNSTIKSYCRWCLSPSNSGEFIFTNKEENAYY